MIGSQQFKASNEDSIFTKKLKYCAINDKEELHLALLRTPVGKNLFLDRVPRCLIFFDVKQNGVIDFEEFMYAISVFHPGASIEDKINCKPLERSSLVDDCLMVRASFISFIFLRFHVSQMLNAFLLESEVQVSETILKAIIDKVGSLDPCIHIVSFYSRTS
ncbi:Calcineurin B-like protein 10 [Linum perenne]